MLVIICAKYRKNPSITVDVTKRTPGIRDRWTDGLDEWYKKSIDTIIVYPEQSPFVSNDIDSMPHVS